MAKIGRITGHNLPFPEPEWRPPVVPRSAYKVDHTIVVTVKVATLDLDGFDYDPTPTTPDPTPDPGYTQALQFNDARNSMYIGSIV